MADFSGAVDLIKALTTDMKDQVDGLHIKTDLSIGSVHNLEKKVEHLNVQTNAFSKDFTETLSQNKKFCTKEQQCANKMIHDLSDEIKMLNHWKGSEVKVNFDKLDEFSRIYASEKVDTAMSLHRLEQAKADKLQIVEMQGAIAK